MSQRRKTQNDKPIWAESSKEFAEIQTKNARGVLIQDISLGAKSQRIAIAEMFPVFESPEGLLNIGHMENLDSFRTFDAISHFLICWTSKEPLWIFCEQISNDSTNGNNQLQSISEEIKIWHF